MTHRTIDKPDRCRHTALTFLPHPALRSIGIPTIFKNTGTCAFQLDLRTLRPSTPPHSCQLRGPHAAGSTLSLGQHPVPGGWSGFCHSEMIWTIPEAMQVGIGFLAPPPCLQNKNLLWGHQTLVADPMVTPLRSWRVTHTSECFSHKKKKKKLCALCAMLSSSAICLHMQRPAQRAYQKPPRAAGDSREDWWRGPFTSAFLPREIGKHQLTSASGWHDGSRPGRWGRALRSWRPACIS